MSYGEHKYYTLPTTATPGSLVAGNFSWVVVSNNFFLSTTRGWGLTPSSVDYQCGDRENTMDFPVGPVTAPGYCMYSLPPTQGQAWLVTDLSCRSITGCIVKAINVVICLGQKQ